VIWFMCGQRTLHMRSMFLSGFAAEHYRPSSIRSGAGSRGVCFFDVADHGSGAAGIVGCGNNSGLHSGWARMKHVRELRATLRLSSTVNFSCTSQRPGSRHLVVQSFSPSGCAFNVGK